MRTVSGNQSVAKVTEFAKKTLEMISNPLCFTDKTIDTKANLKFSVLENLCDSLFIEIKEVRSSNKHLDALVNRRNNIAHGGREQRLTYDDVEKYAQQVIELMEALEADMTDCVLNSRYLLSS